MTERIVRPAEARHLLGCGTTKFNGELAPRLQRISLGTRAVGFTLSSIERLIGELAAATPTAPKLRGDTTAATAARKAARSKPKRRR